MIDPRTVRMIHEQKVNEILRGNERNYIETAINWLWTILRGWSASITTRLYIKPAHQHLHEIPVHNPCCKKEVYP